MMLWIFFFIILFIDLLIIDWLISYLDLDPYDRSFLVHIINENFLTGATERNTCQRREIIFARASEALRAG